MHGETAIFLGRQEEFEEKPSDKTNQFIPQQIHTSQWYKYDKNCHFPKQGQMAQWLRHWIGMQRVPGSNPGEGELFHHHFSDLMRQSAFNWTLFLNPIELLCMGDLTSHRSGY